MKNLNLRNKVTNSHGITLVALVITIVVLLILATVTVQTLTGNNGLITKAETAVQSNKESQELEKIQLAVLSVKMKNNGKLSTDDLNNELNVKTIEKKGYNWYYNGYSIDEKGNVEKYNKILPKEYHQVEYIESSGTQYIDTRINSNTNMFIELEMSYNNNTPKWGCIFGMVNSINNTNTYIAPNSTWDKNKFFYHLPNALNWENSFVSFTTNKTRIIYDGINGNINAYTYSFNFAPINYDFNADMYLFAYRNLPIQSIQPVSAKLYNCYISKDNITRNFIPCYSTTTVTDVDGIERPVGTVGMYDTVEGKFYVNKGTGTFGYETEDGTYVSPQNN